MFLMGNIVMVTCAGTMISRELSDQKGVNSSGHFEYQDILIYNGIRICATAKHHHHLDKTMQECFQTDRQTDIETEELYCILGRGFLKTHEGDRPRRGR